MSDLIVQHALRNVWCTPRQDKQLRIKIARLTNSNGVRNFITLNGNSTQLPTTNETWHVYQFGQVHFELYNINTMRQTWISIERLANRNNALMELYTDTGKHYPLSDAYLIRTLDNNYLLAVRQSANYSESIASSTLYFRTYSNAYYQSVRSYDNERKVLTLSRFITNNFDLVTMVNTMLALQQEDGHTYAFVNGYYVDVLNPLSLKVNDYVEIVQDSSIKQVIHIPVSGLNTFESTLDSKTKYLLRGTDIDTSIIEYEDDVDVFVSISKGSYRKGVSYIKNAPDAMRMLTHKDYAIPTTYLDAQVEANSGIFPSILDTTLTLFIRHSGYDRPLILEATRIHELYKLTDSEITQAMVGAQATLSIWQAATLEAAAYPRMMRSPYGNITVDDTDEVYGYYGIAKLVGDSPLPSQVVSGVRVINLPPGMDNGGVVYEYNANGVLLGFYTHTSGLVYPVNNQNCVFGEIFIGRGRTTLDQKVDVLQGLYEDTKQYRFYRCPKVSGIPNDDYIDVTGTSEIIIADGQYQWQISNTLNRLITRREDYFLAYTVSKVITDGLLNFTIMSVDTIGGVNYTLPVLIPTARLDIWLNGRALVRHVDYHVRWPEVYIVNRSYVNASGPQLITIRAYGLPNDDLSEELPSDYGFVEYGTLSRNNRFDIHDAKVLRLVAGGSVKRRSDVKISEDKPILEVSSSLNGRPYCIWDQIVPIGPYTNRDLETFRQESLSTDEQISDYITPRFPDTPGNGPSPIANRYQLVSPFLAKITQEILDGSIESSFVYSQPSTQEIVEYLQPYEGILYFDPTQNSNNYQENVMLIRAHPIRGLTELNVFQFRFIEKVIAHYLHGRVEMTTNYTLI